MKLSSRSSEVVVVVMHPLDLSDLKELNNTPIGGRGAFPGPDVLAINVYTTSGNDFTGNLVLRWSEARHKYNYGEVGSKWHHPILEQV